MKTLFAVTHINKDGMRMLTRAAQGRCMFPTRDEGDVYVRSMLANNSTERLCNIFGAQAVGTFRVDPFECWDHGDPVGIYVDDPSAPFDEMMQRLANRDDGGRSR